MSGKRKYFETDRKLVIYPSLFNHHTGFQQPLDTLPYSQSVYALQPFSPILRSFPNIPDPACFSFIILKTHGSSIYSVFIQQYVQYLFSSTSKSPFDRACEEALRQGDRALARGITTLALMDNPGCLQLWKT